MKKHKTAIMWVLTIFMFGSAIICFPSIASIIMLVFSVAAVPIKPWQEFLSEFGFRGWLKGLALCAIFIFSFLLAPMDKLERASDTKPTERPYHETAPSKGIEKGLPPAPETANETDEKEEDAPAPEPVKEPLQDPKAEPSPAQDLEPEPEPESAPELRYTPPEDTAPEPEPQSEPVPATEPEPIQQIETINPAPEPAEVNQNTNDRQNWPAGQYLGSIDSDKYHNRNCRGAESILPENEIWFESEEQAQAAGYVRCGICW